MLALLSLENRLKSSFDLSEQDDLDTSEDENQEDLRKNQDFQVKREETDMSMDEMVDNFKKMIFVQP